MTTTPIDLRPCGDETADVLSGFVDVLGVAADRAAAAVRSEEVTLSLAGVTIRLRLHGRALGPLVGDALGHHAGADGDASVVIDVWDVAETGVARPTPPTTGASSLPGARAGVPRRAGPSTPLVMADYRRDIDTLYALDVDGGRGFVCTSDAASLPGYERSAPLLPILQWVLARHGVQVIHGGAVVHDGRAALVVGPGGAGKSTTCLATVGTPLGCLADDYCAVAPGEEGWEVHGISRIAKIERRGLELLPALASLVDPDDGEEVEAGVRPPAEKILVHLDREGPVVVAARVAAVVVPDLTGVRNRTAPRFEPISPAAAFRAMAPSTIAQLRGSGPGAARVMARVVADTAAYRLRPTTDPTRLPDAFASLLDTGARR